MPEFTFVGADRLIAMQHAATLRGVQQCGDDLEAAAKIRVASALYDIGKLGIPEAILLKPGRLTPEEFERMKQHTTVGAVILGGSKTEILQIAERIALSHHEKFDGTGYPGKSKNETINLYAAIIAVADAYDAMIFSRSYRAALKHRDAVAELKKNSGTQFDPRVVTAFDELFKEKKFRKFLSKIK